MPQNYLPTRIANFIGREDVLKQIDEEFFKNNKKVISLNSFSGTGKTTTAIEFGYRFVEKFKECFVYFMKSDRNNIDLEFKNFASECKIADLKSQDKKGLIGKVKEKLCELNEKVLFIFDNCDNLKSVGLYLSIISNLENVFFLITTSDENLSGDIDSLLQRGVASKRLLIEPFSKTESLQFLKNNLERKIQDENDLIEFLDLTGFSNSPIRPYILTRMVAYVKLKTGETIRLKSFNNDLKSKKVLKENVYEGNEMFDTLIKRDKEAWNLLKYSSFLNPDFVPTDIYIDILELDGDTLDKSIRRLRELSLINVDNNDEGVKVHRALQIETKQYLSSTKEDEFNQIKNQLTEKLTNVLKKEFKEQREKKWNAKKYYYNFKMIIENINVLDGQLDDDTARLFSLFGKYLRKFELNYQECLGFYENSLSFYKIKEDEPVIADCLKNIGETYFSLGHGYYEKALDYFEQSILLNKKLKDHENIANNLHNIGMVNIDIGEYEKALDNFENALRIKKEIFPNTISKSIADTLHIIGRACSRIGKYRKSIEYHEQALLIYENLKEDSDIATELKHMGLVYNYTGEYEKAIDSYKKSIEINRKVLDQDNSNIAYTCICLANVYVNSKSYEQAEQFNKEGFKILNMLPKDRYFDYSTALYYANIGSINMHIGKSDLALEFSEKALKLFQDLFPKDKIIYIGQIMNNIGLVYLNKKNFEKAKIYLHNSLQVYMQLFKDNEPNLSIAQAYENMAKYHETLGNKPEALKIRSEMYTKH